jgi:hypothetical protein
LPEQQRVAVKKGHEGRLVLRPAGKAFLKFKDQPRHVVEPLLAVDGDGAGDDAIEPGGQIRPVPGQRNRLAEAGAAEGFHLAIGISAAGKGAIKRDTDRENVGKLVALLPREKLGRHVARRAGYVAGREILHPRQPDHAEIDQFLAAVALDHDIVRLDVAVDDAEAMERRHRLGELQTDRHALGQRYRRRAAQTRFKRRALIERHHRVEAGLAIGCELDHRSHQQILQPCRHPGFAQEGEAIGGCARHGGLGKFDRDGSAVHRVDRLEQPAIMPVREQGRQFESVNHSARRRSFADWQPGQHRSERGLIGLGGLENVDHHCGRIVIASCSECCGDDALGVSGGRGACAEQIGDAPVRQHAMHAVTAQQEAIVRAHRLDGMIEAHRGLDADRAIQDVRHVGTTQRMILGEPREFALAQSIGAAVTDVQDMRGAAAKGERCERGGGVFQRWIALALGMQPAVYSADGASGRALDADRFALAVHSIDEAPHREFGRDAPALGAADPIRECGHDALRVSLQAARIEQPDIIFIGRAAATFGREAGFDSEAAVFEQLAVPGERR